MNPYTVWISRHPEEKNETYHCSPAYNSEDMIWEGSDAEETLEETQVKRLRYEAAAKRYVRGHLPVLQSTSLRGPFDRKSGWENPWRCRSRKPRKGEKKDDWWQPRSEDMLFTRENVMRRAADHGLGYLTPAEALAWCKESANAEVEATNGGIMESIEPDEEIYESDLPVHHVPNTGLADAFPVGVAKPSSIPSNIGGGPASFNDKAAQLRSVLRNTIRGTKRPTNSQWLKGSYVPKRFRWDGPAMASPTPLSDVRGERRQGTSRHTGLNAARLQPVSRGTISLPQPSPEKADTLPSRRHVTENRPTGRDMLSKQVGASSILDLDNRSPSFESTSSAPQEQMNDGNGLSEEYQDSISAISFCYGSSLQPHRTPSDAADHLLSSIKSGDSVDTTHQAQQTGGTQLAEDVESNVFRQLRHESETTIVQTEDSEMMEEVSFITEVAPSCPDLEKFQYRKKRRLVHQERADSEPQDHENDEDAALAELNPPSLAHNSSINRFIPEETTSTNFDDDWNTSMEEIESSVKHEITTAKEPSLSPEITSVESPFPKGESQLLDSTTPPRSEKSDASWDKIDDLVGSSSFKRKSNSTPVRSTTPTSRSPREHRKSHAPVSIPSGKQGFIRAPSDANGSILVKGVQHLISSPRSSHPLGIPKPNIQEDAEHRFQQNKSLYTTEENGPLDENDVSVQSANTPTRSMKTPRKASLPLKGAEHPCAFSSADATIHTQELIEEGKGHLLNENIEDEMECVQKALSQNFPNLSSGSSPVDESTSSQDNFDNEIEQDEDRNVIKPINTVTPKPTKGLQSSYMACDNDAPDQEQLTATISRGAETPLDSHTLKGTPGNDDPLTSFRFKGDKYEVAKTTDTPSEASWQRRGTQSPWVVENNQPLPSFGPSGPRIELSLSLEAGIPLYSYNPSKRLELTEWQHIERPVTPEVDGIKTFEDFMTPIVPPEPSPVHIEADGILSTQLLMAATTNNPWASSLRKANSAESKKRVSFRVLPSDEKENLQSDNLEDSPSVRENSETPLGHHIGAHFKQGRAVAKNFEGHFTAARMFKRILPDKSASQMNSSPAEIDAMAAAFLAADRDAKTEQQKQRENSRSPVQYYKSPPDIHEATPWDDDLAEDTATDFDMDGALEEMGEYLEDWSVEAEIKKGKEARECAGNGLNRRRLFGIV